MTELMPRVDLDRIRTTCLNNKGLVFPCDLHTTETWLPTSLVEAGFFSSGSQVKKNRPDLWRDGVPGEEFRINKWAEVMLILVTEDEW